MEKIKNNGMELEEFTSDKPVVFGKPVRALCWNNSGWQGGIIEYVIAFIPRSDSFIAVTDHSTWPHMALLPDHPKPRRATNRELAKWLAQGKGEWRYGDSDRVHANIGFGYDCNKQHVIVDEKVKICKWDDTEWHEPDVEYMGIEVNDEKK